MLADRKELCSGTCTACHVPDLQTKFHGGACSGGRELHDQKNDRKSNMAPVNRQKIHQLQLRRIDLVSKDTGVTAAACGSTGEMKTSAQWYYFRALWVRVRCIGLPPDMPTITSAAHLVAVRAVAQMLYGVRVSALVIFSPRPSCHDVGLYECTLCCHFSKIFPHVYPLFRNVGRLLPERKRGGFPGVDCCRQV